MATPCPVIDADGHILERQDEIRPYLEGPYKDRKTPLWPSNFQPWDSNLTGKIEPPCGYGWNMPAKDQVELWNRILDDHDIEQAVLFSTGSANVDKLQEPAWCNAVAKAVNTHFATDYKTDRLHPMGVLPMNDPQAAAREVERATKDLGLKGFEVLTDGHTFALGDPFFDPVFEAAEAAGATIALHGTRHWAHEWGCRKLKTFAEVHAYGFPAGMILNFTSVMCQGVTNRFPKLKLAFLEIGATWLPYYLDRLDEHYEKRAEEEMPHLTKKPSDTFRDSSIKVSIEGKESTLNDTIAFVGAGHLVYATDVPHWDCEFPENLTDIRESNSLNDAEKQALLYDNAKELFSLQ